MLSESATQNRNSKGYIMAKVTGPLFSMSASGSIGKAIVFSAWKGVQYVREHVIPTNKMTEDQGNVRLMLGGFAKALAPIVKLSTFYNRIAPLVPSGQSWISYCIQYLRNILYTNATTYEAMIAAVAGHSANADWIAAAADANLHCFDVAYKGTTSSFNKQAQLYAIAELGFSLGFTTTPFNTALASWTATEIDALVAEFTTVA